MNFLDHVCGSRKDKYNKKINKYHVEVDEDDESVDEDLERETKTSIKARFYVRLS